MKHCPECGTPLSPRVKGRKGAAAKFCSKEHQDTFQKRQAKQGRAIVALAKAWRASRNRKEDREVGAKALNELCTIIDGFNFDDRKAGRANPVEYVADLLDSGFRYIDRKKG